MSRSQATGATTERRPVDPTGRRRSAKKQTLWTELRYKYGLTIVALAGLIAAWQAYIWIAQPNPRLLPGPWAVAYEIYAMHQLGFLWPAFQTSMYHYAIGTGLAIVVGLTLSLLIGLSKLAQVTTMPYFWAMFSMPRVALVPLFILWFGLGFRLTVAIVFASAVVPLVIQVIEGMRTTDGGLLKMSTMFCASRTQTLRKVVLPGTIPYVANGMRQCMSRGFIGLVVVEMLVGQEGLGVQAMRASLNFNTARVMAMILVLIAVAVVLIVIARMIEDSVSKWRETVAV